jgi:hypothetical protein
MGECEDDEPGRSFGALRSGAAIFESENFSQSEVAVETVVEAEGVALYHLEGVALHETTREC